MNKITDLDQIFPEDTFKDHLSFLNKSAIHQYKISTESASNIVSQQLYNDVWQKNKQLFHENSTEIIKSVKQITQDINTNNTSIWKSSLSNFEDPIALFEASLASCTNNCLDCTTIGLDRFKNRKCTCNLNIKPNTTHKDITQAFKSQQCSVITLQSDSSNDESMSDDNLRQVFKPKFGRPKPFPGRTNNTTNHATSSAANYSSYPDIDLVKESDKFSYKNKKAAPHEDETEEDDGKTHKSNVAKITFKTAKEVLASNTAAKRTLGTSRKVQAKFVSPMIGAQDKQDTVEPEVTDERLKHIDPKMIELIESEIIDKGNPIGWDDIAGLEMAKSVIQEAVVWPLLRPDIFTGLRRPPKGILLFGPPGTGKTLIGKCVAAQCHATFFSISASSLTSKWIGDGEKMVRALFAVARTHQPAVIFIDEIDSLLTQRNDTEHEATRRIKTEFLVQFDGAATGDEDRILIVGATNRPQELDEAARRRLVKRLYIPLPDAEARKQIISNLLRSENNSLTPSQVSELASLTGGYSGADVRSLCSEAAMGPVRAVPLSQIVTIQRDKVRPVNLQDFKNALQRVRPSVSQDDLGQYVKWNQTYGQGF